MKVLVVGSGGREHALAWKLARSPLVTEVIAAPGNAGTALVGRNADVAASDLDGLTALAQREPGRRDALPHPRDVYRLEWQ